MAVVNVIPETLASFINYNDLVAAATKWGGDNGKWIKDILDKHQTWLAEEGIEGFQAAYDGFLKSVDDRDKERGDDVNHKLQVNYSQLIIDTIVDYMTGKPIVWTVEDAEGQAEKAIVEEYRKEITKRLKGETARRVMAEWLRQGSIAGYSALISWVDEKGRIEYDEFPAQEVIPVYDTNGRLQLVLRYYIVEDVEEGGNTLERTRVEVYDGKYVTYYISTDSGQGDGVEYHLDEAEIGTGNPIEHKAGRIPVAVFVNGTAARYEKRLKKNGTSDLGNGVMTLLEAYAHGLSDKANTVDRLLDQYLLLEGVDTDKEEVQKMRKNRAIALKHIGSKASFIAPIQDDDAVENYLTRVKDTIYEVTNIPKLTDLQGATATEIKMKYASLDIKAGKKELYFIEAIRQHIEITTDMLNYKRLLKAGLEAIAIYEILAGEQESKVPLYNPEWVSFTINRNLPQNFLEIANIVKALTGVVPDAYLYELLWFVEDPVAALKEMKKQKDEEAKREADAGINAMGFGDEFNNLDGKGGKE